HPAREPARPWLGMSGVIWLSNQSRLEGKTGHGFWKFCQNFLKICPGNEPLYMKRRADPADFAWIESFDQAPILANSGTAWQDGTRRIGILHYGFWHGF